MGKLSPTMQDALDRAKANGGELVRWPGGYWTYRGCPSIGRAYAQSRQVPQWWCGLQTIMGLVSRGHLEITERLLRGDPKAARIKEEKA